jgi:hypothetical protein
MVGNSFLQTAINPGEVEAVSASEEQTLESPAAPPFSQDGLPARRSDRAPSLPRTTGAPPERPEGLSVR